MPPTLFLDRCPDDCTIVPGADDATIDASSLVDAPAALTRMPRLDLVWADAVICVQEALEADDVAIAVVEPAPSTDYVEVKIAGVPAELGLPDDVLAAAPTPAGCDPLVHGLGFVFSNIYDLAAEPERAAELCAATVAQARTLLALDAPGCAPPDDGGCAAAGGDGGALAVALLAAAIAHARRCARGKRR